MNAVPKRKTAQLHVRQAPKNRQEMVAKVWYKSLEKEEIVLVHFARGKDVEKLMKLFPGEFWPEAMLSMCCHEYERRCIANRQELLQIERQMKEVLGG